MKMTGHCHDHIDKPLHGRKEGCNGEHFPDPSLG